MKKSSRVNFFGGIIFLLVGQTALADLTQYQKVKALFDAGAPLSLSDIPNNAISNITSASQSDAPAPGRAVWNRVKGANGQETARYSEVTNYAISDEEAAAHLNACERIVPPLTLDKSNTALTTWRSYAGIREMDPSPGGQFTVQHEILFRSTKDPQSGKNVITARLDIQEPGFTWSGWTAGNHADPKSLVGAIYISVDSITPVVPSTSVKADCNQLVAPWSWEKVGPPYVPGTDPGSCKQNCENQAMACMSHCTDMDNCSHCNFELTYCVQHCGG